MLLNTAFTENILGLYLTCKREHVKYKIPATTRKAHRADQLREVKGNGKVKQTRLLQNGLMFPHSQIILQTHKFKTDVLSSRDS